MRAVGHRKFGQIFDIRNVIIGYFGERYIAHKKLSLFYEIEQELQRSLKMFLFDGERHGFIDNSITCHNNSILSFLYKNFIFSLSRFVMVEKCFLLIKKES